MTTYLRSDVIRLNARFYNSDGVPTDPTTPRLDIIDPSGDVIQTNLVPTDAGAGQQAGRFYYDYTIPADAEYGTWRSHWDGTLESVVLEADGYFDVAATNQGHVDVWAQVEPYLAAQRTLVNVVYLTSASGTYTTPAGITALEVEVQASGAAGGGCGATTIADAAASEGGGSGGWAKKLIESPAATYAYTIAAAGTGAASSANGGDGGDAAFGTAVTAGGGKGGKGAAASAVARVIAGALTAGYGGTGASGDVNVRGGAGKPGLQLDSNTALGGDGGDSQYGGGGRAPAANTVGNDALAQGGGGSGASGTNTSAKAGGAGGAGFIIVREYA